MGLAICTCARGASCQSSPGACGQPGSLGAEPCVWCRRSIPALVPSEGCLEQAGGPVVQNLGPGPGSGLSCSVFLTCPAWRVCDGGAGSLLPTLRFQILTLTLVQR